MLVLLLLLVLLDLLLDLLVLLLLLTLAYVEWRNGVSDVSLVYLLLKLGVGSLVVLLLASLSLILSLHLLHHLLHTVGLSLVFVLELSFELVLEVDGAVALGSHHLVLLGFLPEVSEGVVFDELLTLVEVELERLYLDGGFGAVCLVCGGDILDEAFDFGAKVLDVQKDIVLMRASVRSDGGVDFCFLVVLILQVKVPLDLYDSVLKLTGSSIPTLVMDLELKLSELNGLGKVSHTLDLDLDDEEILLPYLVILRVDRTLKHLKLSLSANLNSILPGHRSVLEFRVLDVFDIEEVGELVVLHKSHSILKLVVVLLQPRLKRLSHVKVVLLVR